MFEKLGISIPERKNCEFIDGFRMFGYHPANEAQDRLIKAALELLIEAIENLKTLEWIYENCDNLGMYVMVVRSRIDNTREEIEKATGRTWVEVKELLEEIC